MKKFIFIYLLAIFLISPLINVMGNICYSEDRGHLCQMNSSSQDIQDQDTSHCHGCHLNMAFPKLSNFSFFSYDSRIRILRSKHGLPSFDTHNNLYRPPIA